MKNVKNKRICRFSKSVLVLFTALCVFALGVPDTADAYSSAMYFITKADFEVDIEKDGSAVIDESWDVVYSESGKNNFSRMIRRPYSQLEYYDEAEILDCYIDDKKIGFSEEEQKTEPDGFLYGQDEFFCKDDFDWTVDSEETTHNYKVKYRIKNLVKLDENGKAVFNYEFIGNDFFRQIFMESASVKINLPDNDKNAEVMFPLYDFSFNGKTMISELDKPSVLLKCRMDLDPKLFGSLINYSDVVLPDEKDFDNSEMKIIALGTIIVLLPFILIGILIFLFFKNVVFKKINIFSYLLDQTLLKNQSKVSRWIFLGCLVVFVSISIYGKNTYQVPSVDLKAEILPDGSAEITETWTVDYINGEYSEFSKDFPKMDSSLLYYDDIEILSCSINGVEAKRTIEDDYRENTYYFEKNKGTGSNYIHWNYKPADETVNYSIKYRLNDAVKYYKNKREAVFGYQFFGDGLKKNVKYAKIVIGPFDEKPETVEGISCNYIDGYLYGYSNSLKEGLQVIVPTMPDYFKDLKNIDDIKVPVLVKYSQRKENNSISKWDTIDMLSFMEEFIPAAAVAYIIIALIISNIIYYRKKKKNPGFLYKAAAELEDTGVPYSWYFFMSSKFKDENRYKLFFIEMLDMIKSKYAIFYQTSFVVYKKAFETSGDNDDIKKLHKDFLENVLLKIDHFEDREVYSFSFQNIANVFEKKKYKKTIGPQLAKWYKRNRKNMKNTSLYGELKSVPGLKSIRKNLELWEKYAQRDKKTSMIYTCVQSVYYSNYVEIHTILGAMCSNKQLKRSDMFFNDRNDPLFVLTPVFKLIDNSKISILPSLTSAIGRGISNPASVGEDLKKAFKSL